VRIFITAIGGFLGGALAAHLKARGHEVTGSTRRTMELGRPFDSSVFERQDAVIHCAHDFTPGAHDANVAGTKAWIETAAALGVRHQIFLSSHAARADAAAEYGRTKHEIERLFLDRNYTVLRPGLVTGVGGLYARQRAALLGTPVIPMLGKGNQPVATVSLADFLTAATIVLEEKRTGAFNLFYDPMPTYRDFVSAVRKDKRTMFLPIPIALALALAYLADWLRLPVPVKPGQIRALAANESSPWRSDLDRLTHPGLPRGI
jgi:nucleoside-diphosphate-sugar epimerase